MGDEATELRHDLVERLRRQGYLTDDRVADAFGEVPRENFLPEYADRLGLAAVYRDEAIVTRRDPETRLPTSSSSQPAIMARMLEMLDLRAGQRVVEIGAGTGYNAALLDRLVGPKGSVTSVELDREVAARAREALLATRSAAAVVVGDGRAGAPDGERVDRIIVTASGEAVARAWYDQLVPGGVLVVPLRLSRVLFSAQVVVALRKVSSGFDTVAVSAGAFMALRGPSATGGARPAQSAVDEHADTRVTRPLFHLTGPALAGLDAAARQRLLVTALGFSRHRRVHLGDASSWALASYAALDLPEERLVEVVGGPRWMGPREQALGVVDAADGSLALLVGDGSSARVTGFGGPNAERALLGAVSRWHAAGRPATDEVTLRVRYGPERPHAWRTLRRGDHWIAVDWARPADS